jgi:predicted transcriptional regulator
MSRNRLETLYIILTIAISGVKKTHILYGANLSHSQLNKFLDILINKELIMKKNDSYITTNKGQNFIKEFERIQSLMGEDNKKGQEIFT